jgi:isocitrate dehydrogenase
LQHIGQPDVASRVHNGWLKTLEEGIHTYDIFREGTSKQKVGTKEFAQAVIARLRKLPETLPMVSYKETSPIRSATITETKQKKELVGVDVFVNWNKGSAEQLGKELEKFEVGNLALHSMGSRAFHLFTDKHIHAEKGIFINGE